MHATTKPLAVVFASLAIPLSFACSSAPSYEGDQLGGDLGGGEKRGSSNKTRNDEGDPSTPGGDPTGETNPTEPAPGPTPPPGDPGACASTTDANACFECCDQQNPGGIDAFFQAADACACDSPGVCKAECGSSYCAGQEPTQACLQCLGGAQQCLTAGEQACQANAACAAVLACEQQSQCEAKAGGQQ